MTAGGAVVLSTAVATLAAGPAAAQAGPFGLDWSGEIGVASDYIGKGLSKSDGEASVFAGVEARRGGAYAKVWASSADIPQGSHAEIISTVGYQTRMAGTGLNLAVLNRDLPGARPGVDENYFEFQADASRRLGPVSARLRVNYTPDGFAATKEAWWIELNGALALDADTRVSAAFANRAAENGADYNAWSLGVTRRLADALSLDVRWHDTDGHARGSTYDGRLVAALTLSL